MDDLSDDVVCGIIRRLTLWDARRLQTAWPDCKRLVSRVVEEVILEANSLAAPICLPCLVNARPCTNIRHEGMFILTRNGHQLRIESCADGVSVSYDKKTRYGSIIIRVRVEDRAKLPTFDSLRSTLSRLRWFYEACPSARIVTGAKVHHPPSEVLNVMAGMYVERVLLAR